MADVASAAFMPWVNTSKIQDNKTDYQQNGSTQSLALPTDPVRLKKFVRKGQWPINHPIRRELWHHICMQNVVVAGSVYTETAKALFGGGQSSDENFNQDYPTFGNEDHLANYNLGPDGQDQLARLLCVIAHTRPDINFCPLLQPIASLLLHYMDAERAFDCLSALLGSRKYKYLDQSWVEYEAFKGSFMKLAKKFASQGHSLLAKQGIDPALVYNDWIWWVLEDLPFLHLIRVMDAYLMEGLKIFYRVALAILQLFSKKRKGKLPNAADFTSAIQEFVRNIPVKPDALLTIGFQFRGLSRTVIDTYHTKFKQSIRELGLTPPVKATKSSIPAVLNEINSSILSSKQLKSFWRWLPERMSLKQPHLIFTTAENGVSLNTFYNMCEDEEQTVLLIKTFNGEVFGAYISCPWSTRYSSEVKTSYFGNGETFLFTMVPEEQQFPWVGVSDRPNKGPVDTASQLYMRGTRDLISIGGGDGEGIHLEGDISQGWSEACRTFNNPSLASCRNFQSEIIEVLAFQEASIKVTEDGTNRQQETVIEPVPNAVGETGDTDETQNQNSVAVDGGPQKVETGE